MELRQCSALITGGAGGLGGATSRRLVALGVTVVIFEPERARAEAFANELGPLAVGVGGDHTSEKEVLAAIAMAQERGCFSINVNAAGYAIAAPATATLDGVAHDMQIFRDMVELHLMGPFNVSRLCAAAFTRNVPDADGQRGIIVNTSSTAAEDGQGKQVAYAASKAGIVGMTKALARDLAPVGIRACAIAPGPIWTPRLASAPQSILDELISNVAFPKRFGKPEEYASLVEAMIRTPFLNGQTIRLDGAMSTALTDMSVQKA